MTEAKAKPKAEAKADPKAEAKAEPKAEAKSWKTRWANKKTASKVSSTDSLPAASRDSLPPMPPIRRLRVSLLGSESFQPGIGKSDVAAALIRGLTADYPGKVDPVFDFEFNYGVFEKAWNELLDDPPEGTAALGSDRWGLGPLGAWSVQCKMHFDQRGTGEVTPPWDTDPSDGCASLCPGIAEKLGLGAEGSSSPCKAFRGALVAAGLDVEALAVAHRELYAKAEVKPRELVWTERPCPGVLASFARFSPEIGAVCSGLPGCGAAILDVFDADHRPMSSAKNVAMLYTAAPNGRSHKNLTPGKLICALQDSGSNISRLLREYNWLAGGEAAKDWERKGWRETDMRTKAEYCLSNKNLAADSFFQEKIATSKEGWLDLDFVRGFPPVFMMGNITQKGLLDALGSSRSVDTRVTTSGKAYLRRGTGVHEREAPPHEDEDTGGEKRKSEGETGEESEPKKPATEEKKEEPKEPPKVMEFDWSNPNLCWDFRKGFCSRGNNCNYSHGGVSGAATSLGGHTPLFKMGTRVLITGLKSQAKFNNRVGECEEFDPCSGRWQVRLGDGNRLKIKEANLERC
mmetsp:Transcript_8321/g.26480  ORF Transcript_8321/g.26480 Transcript_8321/m.26480 type:complete len:574 (-) Transcript_8321:79-1800(-)